MSKTIKAADLSDAIQDILSEYGERAHEVIREETAKLGKTAAKELRKKSPKLTGSYAKGWKVKTFESRFGASAIAYNKTDYQLTHLLENGHLNRDGSRTPGISHIKPVNDSIQKSFVDAVKKGLQQ